MTRQAITLVGAFPPPVGGASKNNQLLYEHLKGAGFTVRRIDVSGPTISHRRGALYHLHRGTAIAVASLRLLTRGGRSLYMVPDGGYGVWYSLALLLVCRWRFSCFVIHHRTFQYIDRKSVAMVCITRLMQPIATHVFLSAGMAERFQKAYGPVRWQLSTNARYVRRQFADLISDPGTRIRVGHLSNLCQEKGFFEAVLTFRELLKAGVDAELHVAGPVVEHGVTGELDDLRTLYPDRVLYSGALSGAQKDNFYRNLDVFVFPTNFPQEAAPNVIYEALAAGVPVMTKRRGCIEEIVSAERGMVIDPKADFPRTAAKAIAEMRFDRSSRGERAMKILAWLQVEISKSDEQYTNLIGLLSDTGQTR